MTNETEKSNERERLIACLALQEEIDTLLDQLVKHLKNISDAHPNEAIVVEINGVIYKLSRESWSREAARLTRRHHGFWFEYRLIPLGKPIS
jgi:uncharacterized membrane-anchored protein YjiN (DUF445 family)